jgi:hypothetical protein
LAAINFISITNIVVDKTTKAVGYDVFHMAWNALFQRFENTMPIRLIPKPTRSGIPS